jgi:hypothetical protein
MTKEQMPPIRQCEEKECAFHRTSKCHAFAITVGGPEDPRPNCDTFFKTRTRCGKEDISAGVGACKVLTCKFNELLMCLAPNVNVQVYNGRAECATYKSLGNFRDSYGNPVFPQAG